METAGEFNRRLKQLQCQLRRQTAAVEELGRVLVRCAKTVLGRDQAFSLDSLKARIMREVDDARLTEIVASNEFNRRKLTRGILNFAAGALSAAVAGQKDPLSRGAKLILPVLDQKAPFGTVLVAVGKEGLPNDVAVVPLSWLARQSKKGEQEIRDILQESGCLLVEPEAYALFMDNLKRRVLDGSVSLPMSVEQTASELERAMCRLSSTS